MTASVSGVKLQTVGLSLMIVGALGLLLGLLLYYRARPPAGAPPSTLP